MSTLYDFKHQRLSKNQIENISMQFLNNYIPNTLKYAQPTPITMLIEKHLGIELDFKYLSKDESILGIISFSEGLVNVLSEDKKDIHSIKVDRGTILIESNLLQSHNLGRGRFTMAHETGHWILHKDICDKMFKCMDKPFKLQTNNDWFEWQADTFASSILMPKNTFTKEYHQFKKDTQANRSDDGFIEIVAEYLADLFQVSYKAVIIRIDKLNLI